MSSKKCLFIYFLVTVLCTLVAPQNVAIIPGEPGIANILAQNGYNVVQTGLLSDYSSFQAVILVRASGDSVLANWVRSGGTLITEWDASNWALNQEQLIREVTDSGVIYIQNDLPINFSGSLVRGATSATSNLYAGVNNPFSDTGSTEYFRSFNGYSPSQVIGTRSNDGHPAIIAE